MEKSITKDYKKSNAHEVNKINNDDKKIAEKLEIDDRVYVLQERGAYITLKDHKDSFHNNPKCRLINPAKTDMGKVSKQILTKIIASVRNKTNLEQWINSDSVIEWFLKLERKDKLVFIQFDICEYYPSISEELLRKALDFAGKFIKISKDEKKAIYQARKTILFGDGKPWKKKTGDFDVLMGSWDGAEI